jgi:acyl dehydratase
MSAPIPRETTRRYDEVALGEALPVLEVLITATVIVAGAIASRDYQDVHHDAELARRRGSQGIFMNILTTNGFVGRYVTDWAGPGALVRCVDIRLGAPNYPGDTMVFSGTVAAKRDGVVTIAVRGANRLGDHVSGQVEVALP